MAGESSYDFHKVAIVFWVYMVLFVPFAAVSLYFFWRRRDTFPIKGREPSFVLANGIVTSLYGLLVCIRQVVEDYPCSLNFFFPPFFLSAIGLLYVARVWRLLFQFELTIGQLLEDQMSQATRFGKRAFVPDNAALTSSDSLLDQEDSKSMSTSKSVSMASVSKSVAASSLGKELKSPLGRIRAGPSANDPPHLWFMRNRHYGQPETVVKYMLVAWCLLSLPWTIIFSVTHPGHGDRTDCDYTEGIIYTALVVVLAWLVVAVLAVRMREVVDGFGIKQEFKVTLISSSITLVIWAVLIRGFRSFVLEKFPLHNLVFLFVLVILVGVSVTYPVYQSMYRPPALDLEVPPDINNMQGLLAHPLGYEAFRKHLVSEFSLENLVFFHQVEKYRARVAKLEKEMLMLAASQSHAKSLLNPGSYSTKDDSGSVESSPMNAKRPSLSQGKRKNSSSITRTKSQRKMAKLLLGQRPIDIALDMYEQFIVPGAPYEVNIPFNVRTAIDERLAHLNERRKNRAHHRKKKKAEFRTVAGGRTLTSSSSEVRNTADSVDEDFVGADIFDDAQQIIWALMETDSYPRFCRTEQFAQLVAKLADDHVQATLNMTFTEE